MRRRLLATMSVLALAVPASSSAVAAPKAPATGPSTGYAIVTLDDAPLALYTGGRPGLERTRPVNGRLDPASPAYRAYQRFLANEHASYRSFLARQVPAARIVGEYDTVLNGFAVELNGASLASLAQDPGVAAVEASWTYRPTMTTSVDLINAPAVWDTLTSGRADAGDGIDVGIIDSGIRADHPFFACKDEIPHREYASGVAGTGEAIVANHGTHVAGTVAGCVTDLAEVSLGSPAKGTISGVAPGADLHDYNVFPGYGGGFVAFGGSAFSHDIALAVEDAVDDGMEVINLSLGGGINGPRDFLAEAVNAATAAGVVAAVSAGNNGPGARTIGSPGNAAGALTAGATTNRHYIGVNVAVTGVGEFGAAVGDFDPFAEAPVTDAPFDAWPGDDTACSPATPGSLTGKVVLIARGTCTFDTKVGHAQAAGAVGVVVYNNVFGDPTAMGGAVDLPAVMVSNTDGAVIKDALPGTVTIDGSAPVEVHTDNADIVAGFSSRGPASFTDNIKPDVTAPGVNILSSVFDEASGELGWGMLSGTSMASPHVAGAAALLLQQQPTLSPSDVKSLLGNNAERAVWVDRVGGTPAALMERGGGRIDLVRAGQATTTFSPMSLSFGLVSGNRPVSRSIPVTVTNLSGTAKTLRLSGGDPALSFPASVSVPARGKATFEVRLSTRGAASGEGDITVTDGDRTSLIPFWYSNGG